MFHKFSNGHCNDLLNLIVGQSLNILEMYNLSIDELMKSITPYIKDDSQLII